MSYHKLPRQVIGLTLVALLLVGCVALTATPTPVGIVVTTTPGQETSYLTVRDVSENALSLADQQIRVRGQNWFVSSVTLVDCDPPRCDCNRSEGLLFLSEEGRTPGEMISVPQVLCRGDECQMTCTPFDPTLGEAFEIMGTLKVVFRNGSHEELRLEDLDLEASRQLVDGEWIPIETGSFTITLRTP
jgi:hypothetical protein